MKKRTFAFTMVFVFVCGLISGCTESAATGVNAQIKIARSSDKILQSYYDDEERATEAEKEFKEIFSEKMKDTFSITTYKNEYESKQIIITPNKDVKDYSVEISDFTCGENVISKDDFEVKHEYYHRISSIYDAESTMMPGYYPDALIPMKNAKEYGLTKIKAGNNQGVHITLKTPKEAVEGTYVGTIKIYLDGKLVKTIDANVEVLDYELSDKRTFKTLMGTDAWYLTYGEMDNTYEMFQKYTDALEEYRISNGGLSYIQFSKDNAEYITELLLTSALKKTTDEKCTCYTLPSPAISNSTYGTVLDTVTFKGLLNAFLDASIENNVNLFEKAVVSMGNIIDEAELNNIMDRAYYVAEQYEECLTWAVEEARGKGANEAVISSIENMANVFVSPYSDKGKLMLDKSDNTTYCPMINELSTSSQLQKYSELENGFWWYTCTQPKVPYPTYHIDDNGTSLRSMMWMAQEYNVNGYLTWDTCFYWSTLTGKPQYGIDVYENALVLGDCYGDGLLFYPGKVFGVDGPVHSMRLSIFRDGIEEYEAISALKEKYAELSQTYGVEISADGVLNEMYSALYHNVKVYCDSQALDDMHVLLGKLLVMANKGIAVSNFTYGTNGKISAKVYAPGGTATLSLNGEKLNGINKNGVYTTSISGTYSEFILEIAGEKIELPISGVKTSIVGFDAPKTQQATVYDVDGNATTNVPVVATVGGKVNAMLCNLLKNEDSVRISNGILSIDEKTESILLEVYSDQETDIVISLLGRTKKQLDIYTLNEGWNIIRIDRICDVDLSSLRGVKYIDFSLAKTQASTFAIGNVCVLG